MQTNYKSREDLKTNLLYNDNYDGKNPRYDVESKWIGKDKDGNNLYIGVAIDPGLQSDNHKFTESLRLMLNEIEQKSTLKKDEDKKYLDKNWDKGYEGRILTGNRFVNNYTYFELFTRDEKTLEKKQLALISGNLYQKNQEGNAEFVILNMYVPENMRGNDYWAVLINESAKVLQEKGVKVITGVNSPAMVSITSNEPKYANNISEKAGFTDQSYRQYGGIGSKTGDKNIYTEATYGKDNIQNLGKNLESKGFNFTIGKSSNKKTYEADTSHIKAFNAKQNEQYGLGR
jgi:hypothetical protein